MSEVQGGTPIKGGYTLSKHARERMEERNITAYDVYLGVTYGRTRTDRDQVTYMIGCDEIKRYGGEARQIAKLRGLHVVCSLNQIVKTVYINTESPRLYPHGVPKNILLLSNG